MSASACSQPGNSDNTAGNVNTNANTNATNSGNDNGNGNWITLFDGTDTDQWRQYNSDMFPDRGWQIEDGLLVFRPEPGHLLVGPGNADTRQ